jgi:hypothetical protein
MVDLRIFYWFHSAKVAENMTDQLTHEIADRLAVLYPAVDHDYLVDARRLIALVDEIKTTKGLTCRSV